MMSNDGKALEKRVWARFGTAHLIAVAAGLVTAVLLLSWTRGQEDLVAVVLAAEDIRAGTLIESSDLRVEEINSDPTVANAIYPAASLDGLAGQVATRSISASEPILRSDLRPVAAEAGLRAMSVPMALANAVGGDRWLQEGRLIHEEHPSAAYAVAGRWGLRLGPPVGFTPTGLLVFQPVLMDELRLVIEHPASQPVGPKLTEARVGIYRHDGLGGWHQTASLSDPNELQRMLTAHRANQVRELAPSPVAMRGGT